MIQRKYKSKETREGVVVLVETSFIFEPRRDLRWLEDGPRRNDEQFSHINLQWLNYPTSFLYLIHFSKSDSFWYLSQFVIVIPEELPAHRLCHQLLPDYRYRDAGVQWPFADCGKGNFRNTHLCVVGECRRSCARLRDTPVDGAARQKLIVSNVTCLSPPSWAGLSGREGTRQKSRGRWERSCLHEYQTDALNASTLHPLFFFVVFFAYFFLSLSTPLALLFDTHFIIALKGAMPLHCQTIRRQ